MKQIFRALTIFLSVMLITQILGACTKPSSENRNREEGYISEEKKVEVSDKASPSINNLITEQPNGSKNQYPPSSEPDESTKNKIVSKIIKSADICYQVKRFGESRKNILSIVSNFKAYVSSEDQTNDGYRISNTMVIRVEAALFDSLVEALMKESIYVEYKRINASDVTEEFVDMTARLKSKKEVEAQYLEILKKARSIDEILDVQEHLRLIREEIESVEGRLKYLNNRVAYSTITLRFYETLDVVSRQPGRTFGSKISDAFSWGWNGLKTFFIGLIYLWPLWIILGLGVFLLVFFIKRKRKKKNR